MIIQYHLEKIYLLLAGMDRSEGRAWLAISIFTQTEEQVSQTIGHMDPVPHLIFGVCSFDCMFVILALLNNASGFKLGVEKEETMGLCV